MDNDPIGVWKAWKGIPGYPGYAISDHGDVVSFKYRKPRILKQSLGGSGGYPQVSLSHRHKKRNFLVHRLVALAFCGHSKGLEVNHLDGNKKNNHWSNLSWVSRGENQRHAARTGLIPSGEAAINTKLTEYIVRLVRSGKCLLTDAQIATIYGCNPSSVSSARRGLTWKHLT